MIGNCSFVNSVNTAFAIQVLQLEFVECNVHSITFSNVLIYNTTTNSNASTGIVYANTGGIRNLITFENVKFELNDNNKLGGKAVDITVAFFCDSMQFYTC